MRRITKKILNSSKTVLAGRKIPKDSEKKMPADEPPEHEFNRIIIILGLPRSGTTLSAAVFDAHDDTVVCYEPWNRTKKEGFSPKITPGQLLKHFKQSAGASATTFVLKETSIQPDALRWVSRFIAFNSAHHEIKVVWTLRKFSHSYLSLIERGRDWWGHENMNVNIDSYDRWLGKAFRAVDMILKIFRNSPGIIYSYEALVEDPAGVIRSIMESCGLAYDDKLLNFQDHISSKHIRGDIGLLQSKSGINNQSVSERDTQWEQYQQILEEAKLHDVMIWLNQIASGVYERKYIKSHREYTGMATSLLRQLNSEVLQRELSHVIQRKTCIVVAVYRMSQQAMNTIYSLSCSHQQGVNEEDYDIVVVENSSVDLLDARKVEQLGCNIRYFLREESQPTPIFAIEEGIGKSLSKSVTIMIDGARMVTPGIVRSTLDAMKIDPGAIVTAPGYHLGAEPQQQAVASGYSEAREAELLDSVDWKKNGYGLFHIACLGESMAQHGFFQNVPESSFLTMPRTLFTELNGFDKDFTSHGGGYANLDLFKRACELTKGRIFLTLSEGTFHQFHGGATTGGDSGDRDHLMSEIASQYRKLRGEEFSPPVIDFELIGKARSEASNFILYSFEKLRETQSN